MPRSMGRRLIDDSRFWGPVPEDWLVGKLWFVYRD